MLTLTLGHGKVLADEFSAAHLDSRGVAVPATGAQAARIEQAWNSDRTCAGLSARPPA